MDVRIERYRLWDPLSPYRALRQHWALVLQLAKRDVVGRYRGSFVGLLWSFFNPLLMLGVYTFVFAGIFKSRWGSESSHLDFAIMLFAGLNINSMLAECANRAPSLILENTNFVKRVVFPLETLAWSVVGSALFHLFVSTIVLLAFTGVTRHTLPWTIVLFPVVVLAFVPFVVGLVWLLSSLGVFLRDLKQAVGILTSLLMFLAPIFYPKTLIPARYQPLLYINPLTEIVEASRDVLVWGRLPDWTMLGWYAILSAGFAWMSFAWFQRTRRGFADVL